MLTLEQANSAFFGIWNIQQHVHTLLLAPIFAFVVSLFKNFLCNHILMKHQVLLLVFKKNQ